jgi:hypothetical protein
MKTNWQCCGGLFRIGQRHNHKKPPRATRYARRAEFSMVWLFASFSKIACLHLGFSYEISKDHLAVIIITQACTVHKTTRIDLDRWTKVQVGEHCARLGDSNLAPSSYLPCQVIVREGSTYGEPGVQLWEEFVEGQVLGIILRGMHDVGIGDEIMDSDFFNQQFVWNIELKCPLVCERFHQQKHTFMPPCLAPIFGSYQSEKGRAKRLRNGLSLCAYHLSSYPESFTSMAPSPVGWPRWTNPARSPMRSLRIFPRI